MADPAMAVSKYAEEAEPISAKSFRTVFLGNSGHAYRGADEAALDDGMNLYRRTVSKSLPRPPFICLLGHAPAMPG